MSTYHIEQRRQAMLQVQAPKDGLIIQDYNTNTLLMPFQDGQQISGTLLGKDTNMLSIDFKGQQMDIRTEAKVKEEVGDNINFLVKKNNNNWQLVYQAKANGTNPNKAISYNALKDSLGQLKKEDDSERLTIHNYTEKVNKAMEDLLKTMSNETIKNMRMNGFSLRKMSVTMLAGLNKEFSEKGALSQKDINQYVEKQTAKYEETFKDEKELKKVINSIASEDLIVTEQNIGEMTKVYRQLKQIDNLTMNQALEVVKSGLTPNVNNLYKAQYSGASGNKSHEVPEDIVKDFMAKEGIPLTEENQEIANGLLDVEAPLSAENIELVKELMTIGDTLAQDDGSRLNVLVKGMKSGQSVLEVSLLNKKSPLTSDKVEDIVNKLPLIKPNQLDQLLATGTRMNLHNLIEPQKNQDPLTSQNINQESKITARRQLLEIQLKMTSEVAHRLNNKGINIDTTNLSDLVDQLKQDEMNQYKSHLKIAEVTPSDENVEKMSKFFIGLNTINEEKVGALEVVAMKEELANVEGMERGAKRALESYATMETKVDSYYGDGFSKVSDQIGPLLESMELPQDEAHSRAAAILIKNDLEVTKDAVGEIEELDRQVSDLAKNLHPLMVEEMIKEGREPLTMGISEIQEYMNQYREAKGELPSERVASAIAKMDKEKVMTKEERAGVLGVYRILNMVEKNKGQALGLLNNQNQDLSLENLLEAANFIRDNHEAKGQSKIDIEVDDDLGQLSEKIIKEGHIRTEIESAIQFVKDQEVAGRDQFMTDVQGLADRMPENLMATLKTYGIEPSMENIKTLQQLVDKPNETTVLAEELDDFVKGQGLEAWSGDTLDEGMGQWTDNIKEAKEQIIATADPNQIAFMMDKAMELGQRVKVQRAMQQMDEHYEVPLRIGKKYTSLQIYKVKNSPDQVESLDGSYTVALAMTDQDGKLIKGQVTLYKEEDDTMVSVKLNRSDGSSDDFLQELEDELTTVYNEKGYELESITQQRLGQSKEVKDIGIQFVKVLHGQRLTADI